MNRLVLHNDIEFDLDLVLHLNCSTGHADRGDAEVALLERHDAAIVAIHERYPDLQRLGFAVKRQVSAHIPEIGSRRLDRCRMKGNLRKTLSVEHVWAEHR